jgi:hypothetical protein
MATEEIEKPQLPAPTPAAGLPVLGDPGGAGGLPFGLGAPRAHDMGETLRALWSLRAAPGYASRVLSQSVGDGCSLGSSGTDHPALPGRHLCINRLLRLEAEIADELVLADVLDMGWLRRQSAAGLRALGRIPFPLIHRAGGRGFERIGWRDALERVGARLGEIPPERQGWYAGTDRLTNEAAWALKTAAARAGAEARVVCGSVRRATAAGLGATLGVDAATGRAADLLEAELILVFGVDPARNHPSLLKLLHHAKAEGARVVAINPADEPGLRRAWIADQAGLAVRGTRLADDVYSVRPGGDAALLGAALLLLARWGAVDRGFTELRAGGWGALVASLEGTGLDALLARAGVAAPDAEWFARLIARADRIVSLYSGGFTDAGPGAVTALADLHLARGALAQPGAAILPINERLGVQGAADLGLAPAGPELGGDFLYLMGLDPLAELTGTPEVEAALGAAAVRVHQGWWLDPSMLVEPGELTLLLPARLRHEQPGGTTSTSTDRVLRRSPEIAGHPYIAEAGDDWAIPLALVHEADPSRPEAPESAADLRRAMAAGCPRYEGLERLDSGARWLQWGGRSLKLGEDLTFAPFDLGPALPEADLVLSARRPPAGGPRPGPALLLLSEADAARLKLREGQLVTVSSERGRAPAQVHLARLREGTAQLERPAANALLGPGQIWTPAAISTTVR